MYQGQSHIYGAFNQCRKRTGTKSVRVRQYSSCLNKEGSRMGSQGGYIRASETSLIGVAGLARVNLPFKCVNGQPTGRQHRYSLT